MTFNLFIVLFFVGGWIFSKLSSKLKLPSILGMVIFGILLSLVFKGNYPQPIELIAPFLKTIALLVILLRAGLGISKKTLKKVGKVAFFMGFLPCLVEAGMLILAFHYLLDFPLLISSIAAFIISAVSPAVVVPSMLDLKERGYGKKDDIPTLVLAGASLDDVFAISLFTMFLSLAVSKVDVSVARVITSIPISVLGGVLLGIIAGFILSFYFSRNFENIRATEKVLLLIMSALLMVELGDYLNLASLLAVMTTGFILLEKNEAIAHELASKLSKVWVAAEIILFVLIGMAVDPTIAIKAGPKGLLVILIGLIARSAGTLIATFADKQLSWKARTFCVISYLPKATVQAALGSIPLSYGIRQGNIILSVAVLSILVTAPLGLILIRFLGPKLLDK